MTTPISRLTASSAPAYTDQVILSQLSTSVTISGTTISAANADNSFNDSGNGFVTAGFAVDNYVNVTGFSNSANNIYSAKVTAIAAGKMTIGGTDGDVIVDEAAGNTITISKWESYRAPYYGRQLIETIENTTAGKFDFNNIPAGFNRLIIMGSLRSDAAVTVDTMHIFFNSDTTVSNYYTQLNEALDGSPVSSQGSNPSISRSSGASSPANYYTSVMIVIEDYTGPNIKMGTGVYSSPGDSSKTLAGVSSVRSSITAAITRVRIQTDNDPTDQLFGTLRLYGEL